MNHEGPSLKTLVELESVIAGVRSAMKIYQIKKQFSRTVTPRALRAAIDHYHRLGFVSQGSK